MKLVLWGVQIVLALVFLGAGGAKLALPIEAIIAQNAWAAALPGWLIRFIGVAEVLGALGLLLPPLTRVRPGLVPLAAAGLALDMLLAAGFHLVRGELGYTAATLVLLALAAFVAHGRTQIAPHAARATGAA